jgi:hypothetical protein
MTLRSGAGGAGNTSFPAKSGGDLRIYSGLAGANGAFGTAAASGLIELLTANGSAGAAPTPGGDSGPITITTGTGGAGTPTEPGGNGGGITITAGNGGSDGGFGAGGIGGAILLDAGSGPGTAADGYIDLNTNSTTRGLRLLNSLQLTINGSATTSTVTGTNLTTLTNGSNADALHVHAAAPAAGALSITVTAGENIPAGGSVGIENVAGNPRAFKADATTSTNRQYPIGIAPTAITSGASGTVYVVGEVAVPDAQFTGTHAVGDVGLRYYVDTTSGMISKTAPSTTGETVTRIGLLTVGGAGVSKILVQIGENVLL